MPFSKRGLCLSPGFHVLFRIGLKKIDRPGCRRADRDVNIWTVPLPNRFEIPLTPLSQVDIDEGVALRPPETGIEAREAILNSLPTAPRSEVYCAIIFLIVERCVQMRPEKGEMRVG